MQLFAASHVFPVSSPPIRDGAVAVEGSSIVAVGPRAELLERVGDGVEPCELGRAALLPGLVNAHCHVELSWMAEDPPPAGDYLGWVRGIIARRADEQQLQATGAARQAIDFMVRRGTVAVGDIANGSWVVPLLRRSALHGVIFHEVLGPRRAAAEELIERAVSRLEALADDQDEGGRWRVVPTPHAPHTTSEPLLRALAERAAATGQPLSVHVAESEAEVALLANGSGGFVELFRERGIWDDGWQPPGLSPVVTLSMRNSTVVTTSRCSLTSRTNFVSSRAACDSLH